MSKLKTAYNLYETKNNFSELVDRAQAGEEITIMKRGEPVAKLVPIAKKKRATLGWLEGSIILKEGWDLPLDDFEGY